MMHQQPQSGSDYNPRKRKRIILTRDLTRRLKIRRTDARLESDNRREGNLMTTMLHIIDAFLCSVGKDADIMVQGIISNGIELAVNNGLELFEIIRKDPISPAICLRLLVYGVIACLSCYYFTLERTSLTVRRLYGIATLSSVGYILWTTLSVLPLCYLLIFLPVCVTLCLLGVVYFPLENMFELPGWSFLRSFGITSRALCQLSILGFELFKVIWEPFDLANCLKLLCHSAIVILYCNYSIAQRLYGVTAISLIGCFWVSLSVLPLSYQLSSLDVIICSVGKKAKTMLNYLKLFEIKLVFDIPELFNMWRDCNSLTDYLKVICYGVVVIVICYLGMSDDTVIDNRLAGVAFLSAIGHFFWRISAQRLVWFRVCCVCVSVLLIVGLAIAKDGIGGLTVPIG